MPFIKNLAKRILPGNSPYRKRIGVFISIPKNGTYTVKKLLKLNKDSDGKYGSVIISEKHERGTILNDKYNLEGLFVFCFVRNPYDRTISWYEYHKNRNLEPYTSLSFEEWVKEGMPHHWDVLKETNWEEEGISPLLQYHFVSDCKVDFVGRVEHFEHDMKTIVRRLNRMLEDTHREPDFEYIEARKNTSNRSNSLDDYYTPETKKIASEILHRDFVEFRYEK